MQTLAGEDLRDWDGPPVILVRPRVERVSMFAFNRTPFLITEGYRALNEVLDLLPADFAELPAGILPQREMVVRVERKRCVVCGACAARAPDIFTMGVDRIAVVRQNINHLIHHRGQLTVYLRLVDVPLPSIYGPTADEKW